MREKLEKYFNRRSQFRATYIREGYGKRRRREGQLLFRNLSASGEFICDHIWIDASYHLLLLDLSYGDVIEFEATVIRYKKGDGSSDFNVDVLRDIRKVPAQNYG